MGEMGWCCVVGGGGGESGLEKYVKSLAASK